MVQIPSNKNTDEFINYTLKEIASIISNVIGIHVDIPVEKNKEDYDVGYKFELKPTITSINEDLTRKFLVPISYLIESIFNEQKLNINSFMNLSTNLSLGLIFDNIFEKEDDEKYLRYKFLQDIIEISNRTYEQINTEIGLLFCPEGVDLPYNFNESIEYVCLGKEYNIIEFFDLEKPLLRLIDDKSLCLVINSWCKVIGFIRKFPHQKSLNEIIIEDFNNKDKHQLIKSLFLGINKVAKNIMKEELISNVYEEVNERDLKISRQSVEEVIKSLSELIISKTQIINNLEDSSTIISKGLIYFRLRNNGIDIYSNNNFILSYRKGRWRIKHFGILLSNLFEFSLSYSEMFNYLAKEKGIDEISKKIEKFLLLTQLSHTEI